MNKKDEFYNFLSSSVVGVGRVGIFNIIKCTLSQFSIEYIFNNYYIILGYLNNLCVLLYIKKFLLF